jgi:hypothetical protein
MIYTSSFGCYLQVMCRAVLCRAVNDKQTDGCCINIGASVHFGQPTLVAIKLVQRGFNVEATKSRSVPGAPTDDRQESEQGY